MEAEAKGSCSPTYLLVLARCPSFTRRLEFVAPLVLWYKETLFSVFLPVFGGKGSQEEAVG